MAVITIMADYGEAWGWYNNSASRGVGPNIACAVCGFPWDDFGMLPDKELDNDFAAWITELEDNYRNKYKGFDWEAFHERARSMSGRLRALLPIHIRLRYSKPIEDPGYGSDTLTEFFPDGSMIIDNAAESTDQETPEMEALLAEGRAEVAKDKYVKVMADYCAEGVWSKQGCISPDFLPITYGLQEDLKAWNAWYDAESPFDPNPDFNINDFDAVGRKLAQRLKRELPDWEVRFFDHAKLAEAYAKLEAQGDGDSDPDYWDYVVEIIL